MDIEIIKTHLKDTVNQYMQTDVQTDKERLLLQDVFLDKNKEVYRLMGIIR